MNIFVIDKATKNNLGMINFIPRKDDRIVLDRTWENYELIATCVIYEPKEHAVLVFVDMVKPYYAGMINDIKWNL